MDFHEELPPAFLDEFRFRGSRRDFHARLRVDAHAEQTILVEHALDSLAGFIGVGLFEGRFQCLLVLRAEGCSQIIRGFNHTPDLRDKRLQLGILDDGQTRRIPGCED